MDIFLAVVLILAQVLVFVGPVLLVVYYLRTKLGLSGRDNPYGAPPAPSNSWFTPKVILVVWVIAVGAMLLLEWRTP